MGGGRLLMPPTRGLAAPGASPFTAWHLHQAIGHGSPMQDGSDGSKNTPATGRMASDRLADAAQ